jgi:excisionase family DNA binding protein
MQPHPVVGNSVGRLFSFESAANYMGITTRTLARLVDKGAIRAIKLAGLRRILFDREDLDQLIESAKAQSPQPVQVGD